MALDISVEVEIERSYGAASLPHHGGEAEGVGCGDCLGTCCSLELLTGI
jgi:hypothetical protein